MDHYPLLAIQHALTDADYHLAAVSDTVETLLHETDGHSPVEAALILANVEAIREMLSMILPASMQAEIAMEHIRYAEDEAFFTRD